MQYRFDIGLGDELPPSLNKRLHWAKRARLTRAFREAAAVQARWALHRPGVLTSATEPRNLHIDVQRPPRARKMDDDNLRGALKPIVDGLVDAGVLAGDSPKWLQSYTVSQTTKPAATHPPIVLGITISTAAPAGTVDHVSPKVRPDERAAT